MATKKAVEKIEPTEQVEPKFSKQQLVYSERFAKKKDAVNALLIDGEQYTIAEANKIIDDFMKGKVK